MQTRSHAELLESKTPATMGALTHLADLLTAGIRARDVTILELEARLEKSAQALESAERRLSRHAEHLARLESRLKSLEHR